MHHFSFVLSIDSGDPDAVLAAVLREVIEAIEAGQFRDQYVEQDHQGSWRFWEASGVRETRKDDPN